MAISPPAVPAAVLPRISISSRPPRTTQRMRSSFRLLAPPPGDWGLARPGGLRVRVVSEPAPRPALVPVVLRYAPNATSKERDDRAVGPRRRARAEEPGARGFCARGAEFAYVCLYMASVCAL